MFNVLFIYNIVSSIYIYLILNREDILEDNSIEVKSSIIRRLTNIGMFYGFISVGESMMNTIMIVITMIPLVIITLIIGLYLLFCVDYEDMD